MKKRITITVCDICEAEPTSHVTIGGELGRRTLDLCGEHAAPLRALLGKVKKK